MISIVSRVTKRALLSNKIINNCDRLYFSFSSCVLSNLKESEETSRSDRGSSRCSGRVGLSCRWRMGTVVASPSLPRISLRWPPVPSSSSIFISKRHSSVLPRVPSFRAPRYFPLPLHPLRADERLFVSCCSPYPAAATVFTAVLVDAAAAATTTTVGRVC